ncbi:MAG: glutamate racemase [Clostridiales bacterium]|jgi:glutamate racemase|nr:glutamate racemase [Clostridiales bacterium]
MDQRPIGVFDSGVGGLTVVSEIIRSLPNEELIYFGDTARVPYGAKTAETVTKFSRQILHFLLSKDVKAIVIACSTASSNSFEALSKEFSLPMIEVISPGVEDCAHVTRNKVVGVIGTEATIRSGRYDELLKEKIPGVQIYSKACPLFVPLAEEGWTHNTITRMTAEIYLQELLDKEIDSLILGCTHYPLLIDCIRDIVGPVRIINAAESTARKLRAFLANNEMENREHKSKGHRFYVSDNTRKFSRICNLVLRQNYEAVKIDIESL